MKKLCQLLQKEGWHLAESGLPIQVGIKFGVSPFGKKHLHKTLAEYFLLLEGNLLLKVNGKALKINKGDPLWLKQVISTKSLPLQSMRGYCS